MHISCVGETLEFNQPATSLQRRVSFAAILGLQTSSPSGKVPLMIIFTLHDGVRLWLMHNSDSLAG